MSNRVAVAIIACSLVSGTLVAQTREQPRNERGVLEFTRQALCTTSTKCAEEEELFSQPLWIPPGTEAWNDDGVVKIQVPPGYVVWTRDEEGNFVKDVAADVTCSCKEGGCSPVITGSEIVCVVEARCTSCCKRTSSSPIAVTRDGGEVEITTREKGSKLPVFNPRLLDIPAVREAADRFLEKVYGGHPEAQVRFQEGQFRAPRGYRLVSIDILGYHGAALVPEQAASKCEEELAASSVNKCAAASCKCNSGTGCTEVKDDKGKLLGCSAGSCSSCTLDT